LPSASEKFLANLGKLVVKFEADKAHYLSKDYSEAQARIDFTTPFFKVSIPKNPIRVEFNGVSGLDQTHRQESDLGPICGELTVNS
jgi:hypothetical protein